MIQKLRKISFWLLPLLAIGFVFSVSAKASADYSCTAEIPAVVRTVGKNVPAGTTFHIVLESVEDGNPMPERTDAEICGTGKVSFGPIVYTKPGDYQYRMYQKKGSLPQVVYDSSVFTVTVRVTNRVDGGLDAVVWAIKGGEQEKADEMVFVNKYEKKSPVIKTGDTANTAVWTMLLGISLLCFFAMVFRKRHDKLEEH